MRSFIYAVILGVVIVISSIMYSSKLDNIALELMKNNDTISACINKSDFDGAFEALEKMESCLDKNRVILSATGNHEDFMKIEQSYKELGEYISAENKTEAAVKCSSLGVLIRHMPSNYKIKAENIL